MSKNPCFKASGKNLDILISIWYISSVRCKICQNEFIPNKYHPNQQVCAQPECQRIRQIQNIRDWRIKNPDYFKYLDQNSAWQESQHRYHRLWRASHKESLKEYEMRHRSQRRQYMREYMRKYRAIRRGEEPLA